jgi:antitoxin Phd
MLFMTWQLQDAKARFCELVDTTIRHGPQIVSRRGVDAVVVVAVEEWRRLRDSARPSLKELLLGNGPRFENLTEDRRVFRRRRPVD